MSSLRQLELPILRELQQAKRILIAGAGGGFDIFSGLPLYFALKDAGKDVFLASLSFSNLRMAAGDWLTPTLLEVTPEAGGSQTYFPERELSAWFRSQGQDVPVYAFERSGVRPLAASYRALAERLELDAVVLADGGTDSLMRGDEVDLGTPEEDASSILAVASLEVPHQLLMCLGFGIDAFHGVCHAQFLENMAALIREEAYLGTFSLTADMPAVRSYREATLAALKGTHDDHASIVCTSILAALEGRYGDHHSTKRTAGSTLWINPLMSLYFCFRLEAVAKRLLYADAAKETDSFGELSAAIVQFRANLPEERSWESIPV